MNKEELCILNSFVKHLEPKHVHTRSCCTHTNTLANVGGVQCFHSKLSLLNSVSTVSIPRLDYSKYLIAANGFTHQHMVINASDTIKEQSTSFGGTISLFGRYSTPFFCSSCTATAADIFPLTTIWLFIQMYTNICMCRQFA